MTISVIIPTLNEERIIANTILRTADLGFDELIIVDGGSTDQTSAIVASLISGTQPSTLSTVRLLSAPHGRARQLNVGARASRGDIFIFLHADTQLPITAKQDIVAACTDNVTVGGRFDVQFDRPSMLAQIISTFMNWRSRWSGIATGDQAIFVKRGAFDQLGGFADIPLMEDIDFSRRLKRVGRIAMLRDRVVTSFRRWEAHGPIKTILLMWGLRFLYWTGVSPHQLQRFYIAVR
ncbi:MAG TPA: TIGR04283 family arsenosugar biosynthesis glycosyltransferase [Nitrospiraceae bacterium]|nr:TIGR04283 family arsenosugar biosynthesis glycosyltransferase [Nitrospiraceae bacterium]